MASFEGDQQGQAQSKFRRMMGIKSTTESKEGLKAAEKMKEENTHLLDELEKQYEISRFKTHMAKGLGLGYGSETLPNVPSTSTGTDDLLETNHWQPVDLSVLYVILALTMPLACVDIVY